MKLERHIGDKGYTFQARGVWLFYQFFFSRHTHMRTFIKNKIFQAVAPGDLGGNLVQPLD